MESSESEMSDIEEYVSMAYKKFTEGSFAAKVESSENTVLSLSMSAPFSSQCDYTFPKNNEAADISWFVSSYFNMFRMDCQFPFMLGLPGKSYVGLPEHRGGVCVC